MKSLFENQNVVLFFIGILMAIVGYMGKEAVANNTKAMDRLAGTLDRIESRIGKHEVRLENHEVRLDRGGL